MGSNNPVEIMYTLYTLYINGVWTTFEFEKETSPHAYAENEMLDCHFSAMSQHWHKEAGYNSTCSTQAS